MAEQNKGFIEREQAELAKSAEVAEQTTTGELTISELEELITDYEQARLREQAAKADKEAARAGILEAFRLGGMRTFRDGKDRVTSVDSRLTKRINYKEAEAMLDADVLRKLTSETTYLAVTVRYKPEPKDED